MWTERDSQKEIPYYIFPSCKPHWHQLLSRHSDWKTLFSSLELQIHCKIKMWMEVCLVGNIMRDKPSIHLDLILKFYKRSFIHFSISFWSSNVGESKIKHDKILSGWLYCTVMVTVIWSNLCVSLNIHQYLFFRENTFKK